MVRGDQWEAVFEDREDLQMAVVPRLLERGVLVARSQVEITGDDGVIRPEEGYAFTYPDTPLRYLALVATNSAEAVMTRDLVNAFPFCAEGIVAELEIESVIEDSEGDSMEGGLEVAAKGGGLMWFVDPMFFANRRLYQRGRSLQFSISALAYSVWPATMSIKMTEGNFLEFHRERMVAEDPMINPDDIKEVEIFMEGARSLFPHDTLPLLGSTYRSPVAAVEEFFVEDRPIVRMLIAPLDDEGGAVSMWLYAAAHVLGEYRPKVGDEIEGSAWIQGLPVV